MTEAEARTFVERWGYAGMAPAGWRFCSRCGEPWAPAAKYWAGPAKRVCRACSMDAKRGIYVRPKNWRRKNRFTVDGRIERRCCTCGRWKPLTAYYVIGKRDKRRTQSTYPAPECITCTKGRVTKGLSIPVYRRRYAR